MSEREIKKQIKEQEELIEQLHKQLNDSVENKKNNRKEYMRTYIKNRYYNNLEEERERCKIKQRKYNKNQNLPETKLLKVYEIFEELKQCNPEYLEEIKMVLSNSNKKYIEYLILIFKSLGILLN